MSEFLQNHLGTILVGLVVGIAIVAIVLKMIRDKKKGKSLGCDCGCEGCAKTSGCGDTEAEFVNQVKKQTAPD